jgi:hypothetical protein
MFAVSLPFGLVAVLAFIAFCLVFLVGSIVLSIARKAWSAAMHFVVRRSPGLSRRLRRLLLGRISDDAR